MHSTISQRATIIYYFYTPNIQIRAVSLIYKHVCKKKKNMYTCTENKTKYITTAPTFLSVANLENQVSYKILKYNKYIKIRIVIYASPRYLRAVIPLWCVCVCAI